MEKTRDQIDVKYKWDLSTIYKTEKELEKDYNKALELVNSFGKKEDIFLESASAFYSVIKEYYDISLILETLATYTFHNYDTDITNNGSTIWKEKVSNLYNDFSKASSFMRPRILSLSKEELENFYKEDPKIKEEYGFMIDDIFRYKDHSLSLAEEKLMASLSKAFSHTDDISSMLTVSDIDFGKITDEEDNEVTLTDTNYSLYISSSNRNVRKNAFTTLYKSFKQFNNTYALALASEVEKQIAFSKALRFNSSLEASLFDENIDPKVYNNLIDTVNKNLDKLYRYYDIKKDALKLDEFHLYDDYANVVKDYDKKYTYEEGKQLVLDALKVLGDDYINNLNKAFSERWIDVYPNKGKRGGAYSGGGYKTNPFVLMNFTGTYHDVSTIAHELGHSMHTYYSAKNNKYQYSNYEIFVAEVASQVNELILSDYMLKHSTSDEEKLSILDDLLKLFKASIFRQTMFAEFEKEIADYSLNGGILTAEYFNNTYYDLASKYFGPNVLVDKEIMYEWERIPHFYYNFYVYKYSTGLAAACYIASNILEGREDALENYLKFLKTGGSDYPLNELKIAGVDLTKPEVIKQAMNTFEKYVDEFEKIIKKVK